MNGLSSWGAAQEARERDAHRAMNEAIEQHAIATRSAANATGYHRAMRDVLELLTRMERDPQTHPIQHLRSCIHGILGGEERALEVLADVGLT